MRYLLNRVLVFVEYHTVYVSGKVFGISNIVRYLRNPNPLITIKILRAFGAKVGDKTTIKRTLLIDNTYEDQNSAGDFSYLNIGNNCYIGDCTYFDLSNEVIIEDNVVISGEVSFITHADCNRSLFLSQKFPRKCEPIIVKNGAWVGFGAKILSGVTISSNSVIGANSVLLESTDEKSVYSGHPAKKIKIIDN